MNLFYYQYQGHILHLLQEPGHCAVLLQDGIVKVTPDINSNSWVILQKSFKFSETITEMPLEQVTENLQKTMKTLSPYLDEEKIKKMTEGNEFPKHFKNVLMR
jgi:hypothetical protein